LIIAPMLAPMAAAMGVNPIHMGIIFIVNLEIGYLTPPVGLNLFVSSSLFKKGLGFVIRAVIPTTAIMLGSLMVITWWPGLSLGLVEALKEKPTPAPQLVQPKVEDQPLTPPTGKVKSLEEMMREAKQKAASDGGTSDATPAPTEPPRVKSLEELMREAKAKKAAEAEAAPEAAPDAGE
jgi:C4-dicarboxylate transporter DctM subunit